MARLCWQLLLAVVAFLGLGCACFPTKWDVACKDEGWPVLPGQEADKSGTDKPPGPSPSALPILGSNGQCYRYRIREKTPKTLLEWQLGKEEDKEKSEEEEDKQEAEKDNRAKKPNQEKKENDDEKKNGSGDENGKNGKKNGKGRDDWEIEYEEPLETDRPDFGAATTTVGKGRAILETGYSYIHDRNGGKRFTGHSFPEAVLRVGLFADWFEFRIGQNHANFQTTPVGGIGAIQPETQSGFQDLYLGVKLALTEQKKWMPQSVVIIQSTVPSGSKELTAGQMLPGAIYLFSWEFGQSHQPGGVAKPWSLSGLIEADRVRDASDHFYVQVAQTMEVNYQWTRRFSNFVEWVALYPAGAIDPGVGPQYYIHPGTRFLISNNIQLDAHLFIGLNQHAIDFFGGPGLSLRY